MQIICKECGKEYPDSNEACVYCGYPTELNIEGEDRVTGIEVGDSINTENAKQSTDPVQKSKPSVFNILLLILLSLILVTVVSIKVSQGVLYQQQWEYKVVTIFPDQINDRTGDGAGNFSSIQPSEADLNQLGSEGWELVTSYLEMETAYPNFGSEEYVTGIQPNVRPQCVVFVYKRQL